MVSRAGAPYYEGMQPSALTARILSDAPGVVDAPARPDPHLVIHVGRSANVECERGGLRCRGLTIHGDIDIVPAGMASRWLLRDPDTALIIRLSNEVLAAAAGDLGACSDDVVLLNRFRVRDTPIEQLAWAVKAEVDEGFESGDLYLEGLATALASRLIRRYSSASDRFASARPQSDGLSPLVLRRALDYIEAHLEGAVTIDDVAAVCGLSASHCKEQFRRSTGLPIHQYVIRRRVDRARALLTETSLPVSQVALDAGFCSQSHLARHMRRVLGVSPAAFLAGRRAMRGGSRDGAVSSERDRRRPIVGKTDGHQS